MAKRNWLDTHLDRASSVVRAWPEWKRDTIRSQLADIGLRNTKGTKMIDPDWITVTVAASGWRKHVRRSAVTSFGANPGPHTDVGAAYIVLDGLFLDVQETEAELASLLHVRVDTDDAVTAEFTVKPITGGG